MLSTTTFLTMWLLLHLRNLHQDQRWKNLRYSIWKNQQTGSGRYERFKRWTFPVVVVTFWTGRWMVAPEMYKNWTLDWQYGSALIFLLWPFKVLQQKIISWGQKVFFHWPQCKQSSKCCGCRVFAVSRYDPLTDNLWAYHSRARCYLTVLIILSLMEWRSKKAKRARVKVPFVSM